MHLKLRIEYDGTGFLGSQLQADSKGRTVQGELERALERLAGGPVRSSLAGRTDTGVHARGQVASLDFPERNRLDTPEAVQKALNAILPRDVAVTAAENAPEGFHARFSARKRAYRYLIWNAPEPAPLIARYSLYVRRRIDTEAMARAALMLVGEKDFAAFAGRGMGVPHEDVEDVERPSTVRTVYLSRLVRVPSETNFWTWDEAGSRQTQASRLFALDLVANAFLPNMIRNIVGTLLEIGSGKREAADMEAILESKDRRKSGPTARPHGLCLLWVEY
ncbi:MAG TPA: tRNA pseudouridine(38-40) synthase TruA [Chloroflexia bacterium]|nr:tRNA pseudouridine(38-40) synthase TruA [Chloroflexia bacterium]